MNVQAFFNGKCFVTAIDFPAQQGDTGSIESRFAHDRVLLGLPPPQA
jgi:hypothetical protein